jgi:hypothetical protein
MDPYIEFRGLWGYFHDALIGELRRAVAAVLPERYVVRYAERTYVEFVDSDLIGVHNKQVIPDVAVERVGPANGAAIRGGGGVAIAEPETLTMHGLVESEQREIFLEISQLDPERRLVTSIEVLSPSNKLYGSPGWQLYNEKRRLFLNGCAHLIEIDLLRNGRRMPMREPWPPSPYAVLLLRKEQTPKCQVWSAYFDRRLPRLIVPLAAPDADLLIELQPLVDSIYAVSRYHLDIDGTRLKAASLHNRHPDLRLVIQRHLVDRRRRANYHVRIRRRRGPLSTLQDQLALVRIRWDRRLRGRDALEALRQHEGHLELALVIVEAIDADDQLHVLAALQRHHRAAEAQLRNGVVDFQADRRADGLRA